MRKVVGNSSASGKVLVSLKLLSHSEISRCPNLDTFSFLYCLQFLRVHSRYAFIFKLAYLCNRLKFV